MQLPLQPQQFLHKQSWRSQFTALSFEHLRSQMQAVPGIAACWQRWVARAIFVAAQQKSNLKSL